MSRKLTDFGEVVVAHFKHTKDDITACKHNYDQRITLVCRNSHILAIIAGNTIYCEERNSIFDVLEDIQHRCACVLPILIFSWVADTRTTLLELTNGIIAI